LRQFDLQLKRGDFACVVAPSGRGKTTVLNLLLGFLSPSAGEIRINGKALSAEQRRDLQSCIAYVKQQPFFIHDTIAGNITLSEREPDKRRLEQAIDVAGLRSLISTFPDASHKMISGNGKDISGGQGQRIALARALYRDAGLFILDEPFSEMDEQSERQLLDYFRSVAASGKIVLLVSHSSHAQAYCNKIVVLDE
jgi:ABC-type transport system involved in cytochrome bd biosynthesis fused ATPase/permease subunit